MRRAVGWFALLAGCSAAGPVAKPRLDPPAHATHASGDGPAEMQTKRIDAVMNRWDRNDSPGCAVAVVRDRELDFAKGYGMADLEHAVPITPDTVFDIGSTSKQFTAAAVLLAAAKGELGLDDDIREHVADLPELGPRATTIRHLLHHTGGLRDYGMLLLLTGRRLDGVATAQEALGLLARQRGRDFEPGAQFAYSNTGYFLLARAVEHATGQSLDAQLQEKVFGPLGMNRTRVRDDRRQLVPGRAVGYAPSGDGWRIEMSGWEPTGPGSVMSTVVDLARWDSNFDDPKVGGTALVGALQARGKLADGTRLDYAAGLLHGTYRGQPTVWHAGGWAGYRSQFERFVTLKTSIVVLCNATSARPDLLAHEIADVVLGDALLEASSTDGPVFSESRPPIELDRDQLDAWVALYRETSTGELMAVERADEMLVLITMGDRIRVVPTSPRRFQIEEDAAVLEFDGTKPQRTLVLRGPMFEEHFVEVQPLAPSPRDLEELVGRYQSDELGTQWTLSRSADALFVSGPVFDAPAALATAVADEFSTPALGGTFRFTRNERGEVIGFLFDINSMRGIRFDRVP